MLAPSPPCEIGDVTPSKPPPELEVVLSAGEVISWLERRKADGGTACLVPLALEEVGLATLSRVEEVARLAGLDAEVEEAAVRTADGSLFFGPEEVDDRGSSSLVVTRTQPGESLSLALVVADGE